MHDLRWRFGGYPWSRSGVTGAPWHGDIACGEAVEGLALGGQGLPGFFGVEVDAGSGLGEVGVGLAAAPGVYRFDSGRCHYDRARSFRSDLLEDPLQDRPSRSAQEDRLRRGPRGDPCHVGSARRGPTLPLPAAARGGRRLEAGDRRRLSRFVLCQVRPGRQPIRTWAGASSRSPSRHRTRGWSTPRRSSPGEARWRPDLRRLAAPRPRR